MRCPCARPYDRNVRHGTNPANGSPLFRGSGNSPRAIPHHLIQALLGPTFSPLPSPTTPSVSGPRPSSLSLRISPDDSGLRSAGTATFLVLERAGASQAMPMPILNQIWPADRLIDLS